jgi:ERCC4-type nuclease
VLHPSSFDVSFVGELISRSRFSDRKEERVQLRDEARMRLVEDPAGGTESVTLCRIEFRTSQQYHPIAKNTVTEITPAPHDRDDGPPTSFGWAYYDDIGPRAIPLPLISIPSPQPAPRPVNGGVIGSSPPAPSASRAVNVAQKSRLVPPEPRGVARTLSAPGSTTSAPITDLLSTISQSRASQPVASGSGSGASRYQPTSTNAVAGPSVPRSMSASSLAVRDPPPPTQARPSVLSKRTHSSVFDKEENSHYVHRPLVGPDVDSLVPLMPGSSPAKAAAAADAFAFEPVIWPAGSFEITLLLDTREIGSKKDRSGFLDRLVKEGLDCEQEALPLGDIIWVARRIDGGGEPGEDQVVLDWVIERKRLDDLVSSITDGRFHEQKHRLGQSGVANVIYLIEDHKIEQDIWAASVATAVSSTQVVDGYFVKRTQSLADSVAYLKAMHETITELLRVSRSQSYHRIPLSQLMT